MKKVAQLFVKNKVFANILLLTIIMIGILGAFSMNREAVPNLTIDKVEIMVTWPGADPEEIEEGISRKVENAIQGLEGIKSYQAVSTEGSCMVEVKVENGYSSSALKEKIQSKIDEITTFPKDAEIPVVTVDHKQFTVMCLGLSSRGDEAALNAWAEEIRKEILRFPQVSQVEVVGTRTQEITIEVSEKTLRSYGLTMAEISSVINESNLNLAGGIIRTQKEQLRVRTMGKKYSGKALADIVVTANADGHQLTLGQIADIKDGFEDNGQSVSVNGTPSALINIFKTDREDSVKIASAVKTWLQNKTPSLPPGSEIKILADYTVSINSNINLLLKNGLMGLLLVFFTLWIFLDTKLAFWAGMGIPVSMAGGLAGLWFTGETINTFSLFGLIMVLGIVADDAIVVGEAIFVQRQKGVPPVRAAINGVSEVGLPVIAAVLTTIVAFIPLFQIKGELGQIITSLPVAVIGCLFISLIECLIMLPAHLSDLSDPNGSKKSTLPVINLIQRVHDKSVGSMDLLAQRYYYPLIKKAVKGRYFVFSLTAALFFITLGLFSGGIVKYELASEEESNVLVANIEFPDGTPWETTAQAVDKIIKGIERLPETQGKNRSPVDSIISYVGQMPDEDVGEIAGTGQNLGGVQVVLLPPEERGLSSKELALMWQAKVGPIPGARTLTFSGEESVRIGAPIEICLDGEHLSSLDGASRMIMKKLAAIHGVNQVESDAAPGKNELRFSLRPGARSLGLTVNELANQIHDSYYGNETATIQRGDQEIEVFVKYTEKERQTLTSLQTFMVKTPDGKKVPLNAVADITYGSSYSKIVRSNGYKRIKVSASVDTDKIMPGEVISELNKGFFKEIQQKFPDIRIVLEGDEAGNAKTFGSLKIWFPVAIIIIYMIIATMFGSYVQPLIILLTIPFGFIGSVAGHFFLGETLSLFSIYGMIALTGVVVNDAIVLINRVNKNLKQGMDLMDAVCKGGARRLRSVLLTSVTTISGLLPLIIETDPNAQMLKPMAISLATGVFFATALTLILIPGLLVILNDLRRAAAWLLSGEVKSREEVEPAWGENRLQPESKIQTKTA